eukprot:5624908-Amphidinium_carterae.1
MHTYGCIISHFLLSLHRFSNLAGQFPQASPRNRWNCLQYTAVPRENQEESVASAQQTPTLDQPAGV